MFSGDTLIGELHSGTPTYAYSWGSDGLVSQRLLTGTPKSLWYHYGPQGETRQLTNSSGTVVDTYLYDAYGKQIASTGSDTNPFKYGGKYGYYTDGWAGIILAGQRWYSPDLKRWLSRDPIAYDGGENLYGYVRQNPVGWVDPSGLDPNETFNSEQEMLSDLVKWVNPKSKHRDREYAGWGFEDKGKYWYEMPTEYEQHATHFQDPKATPEKACMRFHTHGADSPRKDDEFPSGRDVVVCRRLMGHWQDYYGRRVKCVLIPPSSNPATYE